MIIPASCRRLLLAASTLLVLFVPITSWSQNLSAHPVAQDSMAKKTHTITISYANGTWSYSIYPAQGDAKKAKIKRKDTVNWVCADGSWQVFFKNNSTPLVDGNGNPVMTVNGTSGGTAGADIGVKPHDGEVFTYGVSVQPNGGGAPVVDDPQIIIES